MTASTITEDVARYYTAKLRQHGATPQGVDWNGAESQVLRFAQIAKVTDPDPSGSLADIGCGYGALLPFLRQRGFRGPFVGVDLSGEMIAAARALAAGDSNATFHAGAEPPQPADYVTASGLFNVRLTHSDDAWRAYILETLALFNRHATRGFAFNCLTSYSDKDKMRPDLYYADPLWLFDHCKRNFARNVALLHDYGLYEFTIIVRK
jgi:SAM-dependent methyltransferase